MINFEKLRYGLSYGEEKDYSLFNETKDKENLIKIRQNPFLLKYIDSVKAYAEKSWNKELPGLNYSLFHRFSVDGNRIQFEKVYFTRWKMLFSLVALTLTDETEKYIPQIEDYLWNFCDQYSWALPAHLLHTIEEIEKKQWRPEQTIDLFAAETGFYLAEILYLLKDKLNPAVAERVHRNIDQRVLNPFIEGGTWWWEQSKTNWSSVCAGSVGCAAIYTIRDTDTLASILNHVLNALEVFLEGFDADGATPEGLLYWRYGFSFYVFFAELLKERTAGKIDLFHMCHEEKKLRNIAEFPSALQLSDGTTVNFSDSMEVFKLNMGLLKRLEDIYGNMGYDFSQCALYGEDHTNKWSYLIRDLFWGINADTLTMKSRTEKQYYFSGAQWFIKKSAGPNGDFSAFAVKGGNNHEPHNHNDLGHFILHYKGLNLLCDLGCPEYVKEYFLNETRYGFLSASSMGHSVPIINGHYQEAGDTAAATMALKYGEGVNEIRLDLTKAYGVNALERFIRSFKCSNNMYEILDNFTFKHGDNCLEEVFITHYEPQFVRDGELLIAEKDVSVLLQFDRDLCMASFQRHEYTGHCGETKFCYRIVLKLENVDVQQTFHLIIKLL